MVLPVEKTVWRFFKQLKIELPYDPAISLLGIYLKESNTLIKKIYICTLGIPTVAQQ